MNRNKIPVRIENANAEIIARIMKSTASKYDCSMDIDFTDGNRIVDFVGDSSLKPYIIDDVVQYFQND